MTDEELKARWNSINDLPTALKEFLEHSTFSRSSDPYYADLTECLWEMLRRAASQSTTLRIRWAVYNRDEYLVSWSTEALAKESVERLKHLGLPLKIVKLVEQSY